MVEECVHILPDGRKCRRIPKRGQQLCPAHRPHPNRRAPLQEEEHFLRQMGAFVDRLHAMETAALLYETTGVLADVHFLIDRRSSRKDRITFSRATAAVSIAADRLELMDQQRRRQPALPSHLPQPPGPVGPQVPARPLTPQARARFQRADALLDSGKVLSPQELARICEDLIGTAK